MLPLIWLMGSEDGAAPIYKDADPLGGAENQEVCSMKIDNVSKSCDPTPERHHPRTYAAPAIVHVSPQEAKELLLRNADPNDPAVRQMLDRIENILGRGASQ